MDDNNAVWKLEQCLVDLAIVLGCSDPFAAVRAPEILIQRGVHLREELAKLNERLAGRGR